MGESSSSSSSQLAQQKCGGVTLSSLALVLVLDTSFGEFGEFGDLWRWWPFSTYALVGWMRALGDVQRPLWGCCKTCSVAGCLFIICLVRY